MRLQDSNKTITSLVNSQAGLSRLEKELWCDLDKEDPHLVASVIQIIE